jgi:hypothetical protein
LPQTAIASEFNLGGIFTSEIRSLAATHRFGFIHSEEKREALLKPFGDIYIDSPRQVDTEKERKKVFVEANRQGLVEVGITFYYDPLTGRIEASEPFSGNGEYTNHNMHELIEAGKYPTTPMHQHWEDLPPSFDDNIVHLVNPYDTADGRLAKMAITVGQQRQWLTIVTTDTLSLTSNHDIQEYLADWENRFDEAIDEETIRLENAREVGVLLFESTDMAHFTRVA